MKIGRIKRVPARELWKHEEHGFTVWLEQNVDVLGEAIGLSLSVIERERKVGPFRADLVAEDGDGQLVIIENQLEPTNHDHTLARWSPTSPTWMQRSLFGSRRILVPSTSVL